MSTTSLRDRLVALRRSAGAGPAPAPRPVPATAGPELHASRVPMPEWGADAAALRAMMEQLARLAREPALREMAPEDLLFLDLETTGLSLGAGTLAFLVGLARVQRGPGGAELVIEQHLLRAPSQERPVLERASELLSAAGAVVTYNGKSYDVPLLAGRCVLSRLAPPARMPHFDALHPARRLLGHALPDVRLVTLEGALWGRQREDDLDGAAIPAAFFASLRGDDALLPDILRHNADDLVTLAQLPPVLALLAGGGAAPSGLLADGLAVAQMRVEAGEREMALQALLASRVVPGSPRSLRRARLARKAGGPEAARADWRRLCREPRAGVEPHEELAKILEHHDRDPVAALRVVEEALARFGQDPAARARLEHRRARLLRRIGASRFPAGGLSG